MKEGDVRRSKLYYLRGKSGKATRVKALIRPRQKREEPSSKASAASSVSLASNEEVATS